MFEEAFMNLCRSCRIHALTLLCSLVSLGAITLPYAEAQVTTTYFPQVVVGGGYTTVFTLMNTGSTQLSGRLTLTDLLGASWNVTLSSASAGGVLAQSDDRVDASYTDVFLPPGGTAFVTASPASPLDLTRTGWARYESTGGTPGGVAAFQYAPSTTLQTTVGVLGSGLVEVATIPVDNDDSQQRYTGYAIANPTGANIYIKIVIVDQDGVPVQTLYPSKLNALWPSNQFVRFLHQDAPQRVKFRGSMVLIASPGQKFCVVALVQNQGLFTAIPVIPAKAPGIN
jgi:hypothetical protein